MLGGFLIRDNFEAMNRVCMRVCEKKNWLSLFVSKWLDCFDLAVETLVFVALAHVRGW